LREPQKIERNFSLYLTEIHQYGQDRKIAATDEVLHDKPPVSYARGERVKTAPRSFWGSQTVQSERESVPMLG
jgi:hypothetical protein